jgi:hypothetical protein
MQRFFLGWVLAAVMIPCIAAVTNLLVDPLGIFGSRYETSRAWLKPALLSRERIYKTAEAARPWDVVILGTSRAEIGLDPASPAFGNARVMNLATSSQPYRETLSFLDTATRHGPPRVAIIGLDFFPANDARPYPADFVIDNSRRPGKLELLFSASTLLDSAATILGRDPSAASREGWIIRRDGHRVLGDEYVAAHGGHRMLAQMSELRFLSEDYPPPERFQLGSRDSRRSELTCIRHLIRLAHEKNVRLLLFVSPAHSRQWEVLAEAGLWPLWELWKETLVTLNEEESARANREPFPLYDFSGHRGYAAEPFPPAGDADGRMSWFIDSSHYRPALGEIVLDRLMHPDKNNEMPAFGTRLDRRNVGQHLARLRQDRETWRGRNPDEVAEIVSRAIQARAIRASRSQSVSPRSSDQGCED